MAKQCVSIDYKSGKLRLPEQYPVTHSVFSRVSFWPPNIDCSPLKYSHYITFSIYAQYYGNINKTTTLSLQQQHHKPPYNLTSLWQSMEKEEQRCITPNIVHSHAEFRFAQLWPDIQYRPYLNLNNCL